MPGAVWIGEVGLKAKLLAASIRVTQWLIYKGIEAKRNATRYLHARPVLVDPVIEVTT